MHFSGSRIWRHELLQTVHRMLRNFVGLRWVAVNLVRIKVLIHDCVTMLQTRFVVFIENFMIRRYSITLFLAFDENGLLVHLGGSCTELG